jgi:hypothetical protein
LAAALDQCAYREPAEVSERRLENIMAIRNAILATCGAALAVAAATGAFAQSGSQRAGAGPAQPSISDQGAAGNLSHNRSLPKPRASLPDRTNGKALLDGNASVGRRGVVQVRDLDGHHGTRGHFRTRGRNSAATVRGVRMERPGVAPATQTRGGSAGRLRLETVGSPLR